MIIFAVCGLWPFLLFGTYLEHLPHNVLLIRVLAYIEATPVVCLANPLQLTNFILSNALRSVARSCPPAKTSRL